MGLAGTRCGLASNVTPQDEGVTNTHHSRLLDSCAGQDRKLMSLDLCQMAAFGSHLLHGRCSPPTAHAPPPLPYTCPTLSTIITHHPRTRTARHPAHHGTLARITTHTHSCPPLLIPCRTVCAMAMEPGLHPDDHPLVLFKLHTLDAASFHVGEGNGSRFRAHNLWRMQWGPR